MNISSCALRAIRSRFSPSSCSCRTDTSPGTTSEPFGLGGETDLESAANATRACDVEAPRAGSFSNSFLGSRLIGVGCGSLMLRTRDGSLSFHRSRKASVALAVEGIAYESDCGPRAPCKNLCCADDLLRTQDVQQVEALDVSDARACWRVMGALPCT